MQPCKWLNQAVALVTVGQLTNNCVHVIVFDVSYEMNTALPSQCKEPEAWHDCYVNNTAVFA